MQSWSPAGLCRLASLVVCYPTRSHWLVGQCAPAGQLTLARMGRGVHRRWQHIGPWPPSPLGLVADGDRGAPLQRGGPEQRRSGAAIAAAGQRAGSEELAPGKRSKASSPPRCRRSIAGRLLSDWGCGAKPCPEARSALGSRRVPPQAADSWLLRGDHGCSFFYVVFIYLVFRARRSAMGVGLRGGNGTFSGRYPQGNGTFSGLLEHFPGRIHRYGTCLYCVPYDEMARCCHRAISPEVVPYETRNGRRPAGATGA